MKRLITTLFAGGVLALVMFGVAEAGPLEDGEAAYMRGDYATALWILRPLAEQGNAIAQDSLGEMYFRGKGVPEDYSQAGAWYRKAAEQGDAYGQTMLGEMYTACDVLSCGQMSHLSWSEANAQALVWYRKAAEQGNALAQDHLGEIYAGGWGVPKDYAQAAAWYRKAADQGFGVAMGSLCDLYSHGQGVPKDYEQALVWCRKDIEEGPVGPGGTFEEMFRSEPSDYASTVALITKGANAGDAHTQFLLGLMSDDGRGVPQDYVLAHMWLNLAAPHETDPDMREVMLKARNAVAAKMTSEQIAEAQRLAREWRPSR